MVVVDAAWQSSRVVAMRARNYRHNNSCQMSRIRTLDVPDITRSAATADQDLVRITVRWMDAWVDIQSEINDE